MTTFTQDGTIGHCPFCDIVRGTSATEPLYDWEEFLAFEPLNPVTPGHLLVIPKVHVADFLADPLVTGKTVMAACVIQQHRLDEGVAPDCNLITSKGVHATQSVTHLHVHLVPRVGGDGLLLPWTAQVVREDKYRVRVGDVSVVATEETEARIRALSAHERVRLARTMGGRS